MTVLIFLYPRLPIAQVVGSDIAHAVPLTFCAGIGTLVHRFGRFSRCWARCCWGPFQES